MKTWLARLGLLLAAVTSSGLEAAPVSGQGTWETTLQARDLDGDGAPDAFYDTALDITWLADASAAGSLLSAQAARDWASALSVGGVGGWRLPTAVDLDAPGCNFSFGGGTDCGYNTVVAGSEMAHMFYVTLGNQSIFLPNPVRDAPPVGNPKGGLINTGNFANLQEYGYWTGTERAGVEPDPLHSNDYISFWFNSGFQSFSITSRGFQMGAWAVRDGDIRAVPEPSTLALAAIALGWLFARRRCAT